MLKFEIADAAMVRSIIIQEFVLKISVSKPAMETKHQHSFTFIEANQCEYCEEQTPSNPQGLIMTYTRIVGKMTGQKTGRYCKELILYSLPLFLCAAGKDTQQTLALAYSHYKNTCCTVSNAT